MNVNFSAMTVGDRIRYLLSELGKSQIQICREIGISKAAMSNYVNENRIPDTMTCFKLAKALGTSVEWLLTGEDNTPQPLIVKEEPIFLTTEEKLLIENYRDLSEKNKLQEQRRVARMAVEGDNIESSRLKPTKDDEVLESGYEAYRKQQKGFK